MLVEGRGRRLISANKRRINRQLIGDEPVKGIGSNQFSWSNPMGAAW